MTNSLLNLNQIVSTARIKWHHYLLIFAVAVAIIIFRKPDLISNPQFWAEDGRVWFQDAYNIGLGAILNPSSGYLQTISRVTAAVAQLFPLRYAPLLFNLVAICIKALPVVFLFSPRFFRIIPKFSNKLILAALYIFLPNTSEVYSNLTNTHTYLALLAFMIIIAKPSQKFFSKLFDYFFLALSGLSGPFVIFRLFFIKIANATGCKFLAFY